MNVRYFFHLKKLSFSGSIKHFEAVRILSKTIYYYRARKAQQIVALVFCRNVCDVKLISKNVTREVLIKVVKKTWKGVIFRKT